jgi:hypothetical protein
MTTMPTEALSCRIYLGRVAQRWVGLSKVRERCWRLRFRPPCCHRERRTLELMVAGVSAVMSTAPLGHRGEAFAVSIDDLPGGRDRSRLVQRERARARKSSERRLALGELVVDAAKLRIDCWQRRATPRALEKSSTRAAPEATSLRPSAVSSI